MRAPHYVMKRARSGRFNFTLLTDHGRINGSVMVPVEKHLSRSEISEAAHGKIRALVGDLVQVVESNTQED